MPAEAARLNGTGRQYRHASPTAKQVGISEGYTCLPTGTPLLVPDVQRTPMEDPLRDGGEVHY